MDYAKTGGAWLVSAWTYTMRRGSKDQVYALSTTRARVTETILNPPVTDHDCKIEIKPGMLVHKSRMTKPHYGGPGEPELDTDLDDTYYRIEPDGSWRQVRVELNSGNWIELPGPSGAALSSWSYLWLMAPIAALALCAFWYWRKRKTLSWRIVR
jgi:hypothetical protein